MTSRDKLINKMVVDIKARCAEKIEAAQKTVNKPKLEYIEEFGISNIMKKKRGL